MLDDHFLLCRVFVNGFIVTRESHSNGKWSSTASAFERSQESGVIFDAFFEDPKTAELYIEMMYYIFGDKNPFGKPPYWTDEAIRYAGMFND